MFQGNGKFEFVIIVIYCPKKSEKSKIIKEKLLTKEYKKSLR